MTFQSSPESPKGSLSQTAQRLRSCSILARSALLFAALLPAAAVASAENSDPAALAAIRAAVNAELKAAETDHSAWEYRDHDTQPGKDAIYHVVETPHGDLRRMLFLNGHALTGTQEQDELNRIHTYVNSPEQQAHSHKAAAQDDAQAHEMLTMLPTAFVWTITGQTPTEISLRFRPNPDFHPPDMQSRVLGVMAGEIVVARDGDRIKTLRGTLTDDVKIGFGFLGKIDRGGTFNVERREVAPGHWQITQTHVHIGGRALLFKTIGTQEDEVKDGWKPSSAANLQAAEQMLLH